jgi:hypothetical protein
LLLQSDDVTPARNDGEASTDLIVVEVVSEDPQVLDNWEQDVRYEAILQHPGVRTTIERHAKLAPKRMTGEQFLALADKLVPMGVSMETLAGIAQSLFTRLGLKTGKHRTQQVTAPAGRVLVRALCSLARRGQSLRSVSQADDGCLLEAALPSDMYSLEGDLLVSIRRQGPIASVDATAQIGGQLFDWGKSNRCLDQLFDDLRRDAA